MINKTRKLIPAAILGIALSSVPGIAQADARISVHIDNIGAVLGVSDHRNDVYFDVYDTNLLFIPALGYFVSYGSPFDILFLDNFYYLHRYGHWYRSSSYGGPWIVIQSHRLPSRIRKHPWKTIYQYRDREYKKHKQHTWLKKTGTLIAIRGTIATIAIAGTKAAEIRNHCVTTERTTGTARI